MRPIDETLRQRFLSNLQTHENNANPGAVIWINRPTTALTDDAFLESAAAGETENLTAVDLAIRRTKAGQEPDRAYLAYVADGVAGVKSGLLMPRIDDIIWTEESFAEAADDVAIVFNGAMPRAADGTAQFVTEQHPWVFWTHDGALTGRILGLLGSDVGLAASNCTRVTAIRATGGVQDFGLVVFFLLEGAIYYRQLIDGVWYDAELVAFGPDGVTWTDIAAWRTWDYRIGIQGVTSDGDVYELFTDFQGLARHGVEHIDLDASAIGTLTPVSESDASESEHLALSLRSGAPYGGLYRLGAPAISDAWNTDDGHGDWGRRLVVVFDRHLVAAEVAAQNTSFRIVDANGRIFVAQSAALRADGYTVDLSFLDFNAASGACSAVYVPGTVHSMAGVAIGNVSCAFAPTGLVPPTVPPPELVSVANF